MKGTGVVRMGLQQNRWRVGAGVAFAVAIAVSAGCGQSSTASFVANLPRYQTLFDNEKSEVAKLETDAAKASGEVAETLRKQRDETPQKYAKLRADVASAVVALFGTPDAPHAPAETKLNLGKLQLAAGPVYSTQEGHKGGLYRRHCVHCHGVTGDGAGPTAAFLNPYPRDFRHGNYKFKSTKTGEKPTDADLSMLIRNGANGTAMPSFKLLATNEIDALVEYVKYLSIRGETEAALLEAAEQEALPDPVAKKDEFRAVVIDEALQVKVLDRWLRAEESIAYPPARKPLTPDELKASIAKGRELFYSKQGNCYSCHGGTALGDGQQFYLNRPAGRVDNTIEQNLLTNWTLSEQILRPRNLRSGVFRGGRRPIDIFRKITYGIDGAKMPGKTAGTTDEQVWSLVDYVLNMTNEDSPVDRHEAELQRPRN